MWLKGGFEAHSVRSEPLYAAETRFYRDLAPRLPINCADAYYAHVDPDGGRAILLLEDLTARHARFGIPGEALSIEQAERAIDQLAGLHAAPRREPDLIAAFPWLSESSGIEQVDVIGEYFGYWAAACISPRFEKLPEALRDRPRMEAALRRMQVFDRENGRHHLVHGDAHTGNMFYEPDGTLGLLDWQTAMLAHWSVDVAYLLIIAMTVEDRRAHQETLLRRYLDRLAASGGDAPDFDAAWLAYRRRAGWSFLNALCPTTHHSEAICSAWAERAGAAITDLATVEALTA
nr:ecdysteroid 22-kinase family protein [Sphingomonas chungangi]